LRSNEIGRQKNVVENDDAKHCREREREERLMEVGGGTAAVVESGFARPPSEGAGVGGIG